MIVDCVGGWLVLLSDWYEIKSGGHLAEISPSSYDDKWPFAVCSDQCEMALP